jgi:hypothetical protein
MLRSDLEEILQRLLREHPERVTLDELGEAVGTAAITPPEIDELVSALEAEGRAVGLEATPGATEHLARALGAARELRQSLGRLPNAAEVAARAGLRPEDVRLALLFARVIQR